MIGVPGTVIAAVFILIITIYLYITWWRPRQLRWGATDEEIRRPMLGDEIVGSPSFDATRAVTIKASPSEIYPWIVQMGLNRAGWYSYDLLDNLGRRSEEQILPIFQNVQVGTLIPMSPNNNYGLWVKEFKTDESMLWWDKKGNATWAWGIYPKGKCDCRLVSRIRIKYQWVGIEIFFNVLIEFFDILMMRKCMLGIKRRAESIAVKNPVLPHRASSKKKPF
jgi:hypothetical protein